MKLLALTLGFGALSAVIPVFNMEAYIVLVYAKVSTHSSMSALLMATVGSFGQNVGKLAWYYASRGALNIEWLQKRLNDPKRKASYDKWRRQIEGRPVFSGILTFISAAVGFPPFFAMAAVAGTLRMNAAVFFVAGFLGRILFFWAILLGVGVVIT